MLTHKSGNLWRLRKIIPELDVHTVDLTKIEEIKKTVKQTVPDIVFHLATYGVYQHQMDFDKIVETNVVGSMNLMNVLSDYNIKKFVNLGSSFEYGPKLSKIRETDDTEPLTAYGASKVAQTNFAQHFAKRRNLPAVTLRIFNAYGMFEEKNRLIPSLVLSALTGKTLHIKNPKEIRDFIFVKDVVDAMIKASKIKKSGIILNIGTSKGCSVEQIVRKSSKITNADNIVFDSDKKPENHGKLIANMEETKKTLGWESKFSIDMGLKETFDWFRHNIRLYR